MPAAFLPDAAEGGAGCQVLAGRVESASMSQLRSAERVDDAQPVIEDYPALHIFGPERLAIGLQRRGGDHRIPGR